MTQGDRVKVAEGDHKGEFGEVLLVNEHVAVKLEDETVIYLRGSDVKEVEQ